MSPLPSGWSASHDARRDDRRDDLGFCMSRANLRHEDDGQARLMILGSCKTCGEEVDAQLRAALCAPAQPDTVGVYVACASFMFERSP